jgi:hypothetical protein
VSRIYDRQTEIDSLDRRIVWAFAYDKGVDISVDGFTDRIGVRTSPSTNPPTLGDT